MCAVCYGCLNMKQEEKTLLEPWQIHELQEAIRLNKVSVFLSGKEREYCVGMPDGGAFILGFRIVDKHREYTIVKNEEMIARMVVPDRYKNFTPAQSQILDLFGRCATKVSWQEVYFMLAHTVSGMNGKNRA